MELMKYIKQANQIYHNAYDQIDAANTAKIKSMETLNKNSEKLTHDGYQDEYQKIMNTYRDALKAIGEDTAAKIAEQRAGYEAEVNEYFTPKGNQINADDSALLNSGIVLNRDEIQRMIEKYTDNPTMLRLIEQYMVDSKRAYQMPREINDALAKVKSGGAEYFRAWKRFDALSRAAMMHPDETYLYVVPVLDAYVDEANADILRATPYVTPDIKTQADQLDQKASEFRRKALGIAEKKS